jgi:hypothetical protein
MEHHEQPSAVIKVHRAELEEACKLKCKVDDGDETQRLVKVTELAVLVGDERLHDVVSVENRQYNPFF